MSTLCQGCETVFKRSGLYSHFEHSRNPQCELYRRKLDEATLLPNEGSRTPAASKDQMYTADPGYSESDTAVIMERQSHFISC
jgi:hypothetical protein